ncbi:MAG: hypothetical protein WC641_04940 [Patescibacteria group bacterium]
MPVVISESDSGLNPDGTPKSAEQLRIAQLEAELSAALNKLDELSATKESRKIQVAATTASRRLKLTFGLALLPTLFGLGLIFGLVGFGMYYESNVRPKAAAASQKKTAPQVETKVFTVPVSDQSLAKFFPGQDDPECFRGRLATRGEIDGQKVDPPSLECNWLITRGEGCKDVRNCRIRLSGEYPKQPKVVEVWSEPCPGAARSVYCRVELLRGDEI